MAKHKYIETPEKMKELFDAYKKEVKSNPRIVYEFVGKDGVEVQKKLERPLTIDGFYVFVCDHEETSFNTDYPDLSDYFENKDKRYNEYIRICSRIKKEIRKDQIEGGMVGQYNASITQRLNGLKENTETTVIEQQLFPDVQPHTGDK